jgi:hypothetical protein
MVKWDNWFCDIREKENLALGGLIFVLYNYSWKCCPLPEGKLPRLSFCVYFELRLWTAEGDLAQALFTENT